ncbi:hypothetical protein BDA96_08G178000 [Sorghum bicolor]|uniref:Uncharacterized protein n=1 Tax=Sorghum bicolor TaxID=4558 RepID=A0A921U7X7_SORBI|nr:hypothetical protein BDA96_08G178000 [Sorghum bicolor]
MVRGRSDIDWYTLFLSYYSNDSAIDASSDSLAPVPQAPTSPSSRQRSEEPCSEFERCFWRKQQLQNSSSVHSREVQDVVLLDDEYVESKEEVNREMSDIMNEPKIYYPSREDQEAVELTRSDIKCLDPEVFLSSPVINFYIK